ncbi:very short patch repair endonuclease [archaeon D22]|nr:very short patch repair endonuclease [archaeon D22]
MTDRISKEHRSWNMSRIRSKDSSPEMRVRSYLHRHGYRFRLHYKSLPGNPDIVMPKHKTVVFVHGCFWHRHKGCKFAYKPKSRVEFWEAKFKNNLLRDEAVMTQLLRGGWKVIVVWECEIRKSDLFEARMKKLDLEILY